MEAKKSDLCFKDFLIESKLPYKPFIQTMKEPREGIMTIMKPSWFPNDDKLIKIKTDKGE